MASFILMPQKGLTEESVIMGEWHVKRGDVVSEGDILFEIETGKATFPVESDASGTVLETIGEPGDEIRVREVVCVIGEPGESYQIPGKEEPVQEEKQVEASAVAAPAQVQSLKAEAAPTGRIFASPIVRRLAKEKGADLTMVTPSGPNGRIIRADLEKYLKESPALCTASIPAAQTEERVIAHTHIRKIIADNMMRSIHGMAQLTMAAEIDATQMLAYRRQMKEKADILPYAGATLNDMMVFALSRTLLEFPECNAHYKEDGLHVFSDANIGISVDTERGLMVPTVAQANRKSLGAISRETKELIAGCKAGSLDPAKLSGGTFTLTNLGTTGITVFTPIINPPQVAILGVGTVCYRQRIEDEALVTYPCMTLSLTIDHRAVDGAPAARFLQALTKRLENFPLILSE
ncbi:MAG: dihydrolipoamide acetyltransferase family protein [Christensenella sp.]|uniref:dihydrolipoamide acetyltransferase family protein n=1 Tax=Christensenella sp. TaxID=1935934 RepID=UPI002B1EFDB7|nr:dihydrolipoamide acetyltransferase family protein [Christensenella sp.]MEA5001974.1 dihydrolipoamide acetyltransferase family protein [Christensenella sp.]